MISESFTVLVDETKVTSQTKQVSLCIKYNDRNENKYMLYEDFLDYVAAKSIKGSDLAEVNLRRLKTSGKNREF